MKKETFLKIAYICLSIMLIALTIGWVISGIDFVIEEVSAEEINDNAVLDFNQYLSPSNVRTDYYGLPFNTNINNGITIVKGTSTQTWTNTHNGIYNINNMVPYNKKHIYYLNMNYIYNSGLQTSFSLYTNNNANALVYTIIDGSVSSGNALFRIGEQNYDYFNVFYENQQRGTYDFTIQPILIDLTQMLGDGNEPTSIEEVKNYLPLNYYKYTTSNLITKSYLDGFNQGAFSMQDGYTMEEVASDLVNTAYPIEIINNEFNKTNNMLAFNGTIGLNTKYTLIANDTIILDLEFLGNSTIDIMVQGNSGNYIKLTTIVSNELPNSYTSGSGFTYYSGVITLKLPVDTNTILFKGTAVMQVYNVKYKTFNLSQAIVESFQNGVNSVDTQAIRDKAFEDGKNWAINHNTDTAWGSSWEFIGSAFSGVGDILSIELLPNIPLWTFIAIPLLFGLIALLYKLIGG